MQYVTTPRDVICARAKMDFTEVEKSVLVSEGLSCINIRYY